MHKAESPFKVVAVIVTYNGMKWLNQCLSSVLSSSIIVDVVVVDNASSDGSADFIKKNFPQVNIVKSESNLGFGKANNLGFKYALANDADYIFLLNQDAWLEQGTIKSLIDIQVKNQQYGIISPMHYNGAGSALDFRFNFLLKKFLWKEYEFILKDHNPTLYPMAFVNAACWLITRRCLEENGGFNPIFPHYGEDNEYAFRAQFKGLKVGVVSHTKIFHDRPQFETAVDLKSITNNEKIAFMKVLSDLRLNFITAHWYAIFKLIKESVYYLIHFRFRKFFGLCAGFFQAIKKRARIKKHRKLALDKMAFLK